MTKYSQIRNLAKLSKDLRAEFGEFGESRLQACVNCTNARRVSGLQRSHQQLSVNCT
jgi:hypothetical protein